MQRKVKISEVKVMKRIFTLILLLSFLKITGFAQYSGTVTDGSSIPLELVQVTLLPGGEVRYTDKNGKFSIAPTALEISRKIFKAEGFTLINNTLFWTGGKKSKARFLIEL